MERPCIQENGKQFVFKGETYTAEIEIRTYPNSAKKKYDIVSINTNNQQKRK